MANPLSDSELEETRKRVLRTLAGTSMLGARLMKLADVNDPGEFLRVITPLIDQDVVQVSGALTPEGVAFAAFGTRPSDRGYIQRQIRKK